VDNTVIAEEKNHIFDMMQASQQPPFLPAIQAHDERLSGFDFSMGRSPCRDYSLLVNIRTAHQTCQAAAGTHTHVVQGRIDEAPIRWKLIKAFEAVLCEQQDQAIGTGVEHSIRWTQKDKKHTVPVESVSGNALNAAQVAQKHSSEVVNAV